MGTKQWTKCSILAICIFSISNYFSSYSSSRKAQIDEAETKIIETIAPTTETVSANGGGGFLSAWIVLYAQLKDRSVDFHTFMESYEMFHNKDIYQKILIVWDSAQNDNIDVLGTHVKFADDLITLDISTEMELDLEAPQFESKHEKGNCFGRGAGYCQMLYNKMMLDLCASTAAKKYDLTQPDILGIIDVDTYWNTLPVKENVVDPSGRIILHTFATEAAFRDDGYAKGVHDMLKTDVNHNAMVQFPIHIWKDTLPKMRQHVTDLHEADSFFDVFMSTDASICEFCLMATYAHLQEPDKYTLTARPHPDVPLDKHASNLFLESAQGLPMVGTMQHENPRNGYSCDSCWIKGCCLTYRIDGDEAEVCENIVPSDFCEMFVFDMIGYQNTCHLYGDANPEILQKHFELVWKHMDQRSFASIQDGKDKCLSKINSLPKPL